MRLSTLIFSKNRASQLELLLRSLDFNVQQNKVRVLYTCEPKYQAAYDKVRSLYSGVDLLVETNFRQQVIDSITSQYLLFETDDDVMIDSFNEDCQEFGQFQNNEEIICLNLRMARNYDYDFLKDRQVPIPKFRDGTWEWANYKYDWGYPMNTSAHIYRSKDIVPILETADFSNPHTLERILRGKLDKPLMIGFAKAKFVDIPVNRVSANDQRIGKEATTEFLNDKFMAGERIALEPIIAAAKNTKSYFMPVEFEWEKYGDA